MKSGEQGEWLLHTAVKEVIESGETAASSLAKKLENNMNAESRSSEPSYNCTETIGEKLEKIRMCIRQGFDLQIISELFRDVECCAEGHYLKAIAILKGANDKAIPDDAISELETAMSLDPNNVVYKRFAEMLHVEILNTESEIRNAADKSKKHLAQLKRRAGIS